MELFEREEKWLLDEKYNGKKTEGFFADLEKLKNGEPLAYLIGNMPFLGAEINLEHKPLIPRTETEFWVNEFIKSSLTDTSKNFEILDIFSGSGCVGIGVLKNSKNTKVDFAEINTNNIKQIKKNLVLNNISENRFKVFQSDVFESVPEKRYDFILANPPYISKDRKDTVQESVLDHEDFNALFAENEGLFFVEKLIKESEKFLKSDGKVYVEYDPWQTEKIEEILKENNIENFEFLKDQYDKNRVLIFSY